MPQNIPKVLHLFWIGGELPPEYQENIKQWQALNPDYQIKLWSMSSSMPESQYKNLHDFCHSLGDNVSVCDLDDEAYADMPNSKWIKLNAKQRKWARASDVARHAILEREGGVYVDTDLKPLKPLGTIAAPLGTRQFFYLDKPSLRDKSQIYFMASAKNHPLFKAVNQEINKRYQLATSRSLNLFYNERWLASKNESLDEALLFFLGSEVMSYILKHSSFTPEDIQYDITTKIKVVLDHSWKKGVDKTKDKSGWRSFHQLKLKYVNDYFNSQDFLQLIREMNVALDKMKDHHQQDKAQTRLQIQHLLSGIIAKITEPAEATASSTEQQTLSS